MNVREQNRSWSPARAVRNHSRTAFATGALGGFGGAESPPQAATADAAITIGTHRRSIALTWSRSPAFYA
jgi:hypothetical protein